MTAAASPHRIIRMRQSFEGEGKPRGYKKTQAFLDEDSGGTLYSCDIVGHVASRRATFCDAAGQPAFSIKPTRVLMPMCWRLTAESGELLGTLNQKVFARGFWAGLDAAGRERFRAVDPQKLSDKIAMQALGGAVSRYVLMSGDTPVGSIQEEKREQVEEGGVKGFFKTLMTGSDPLLRLEPAAAESDTRLFCGFMLLLYEITVPLDRST